ncbi:MAG: hypothetical protein MUD01_22535, partial [Chloroflexaceae bacterium]|nr:hypothetical protein [Chloroflexaceae bacterium]
MTGTIERIIRSLDVALDRRKLVFAMLSLLLLGLVFGAVVVVSGLFGQLAGWLGAVVLIFGMLLLMALNGVTTGGLSYMMV